MQEKDGFIGHMIFWESLLPPNFLPSHLFESKFLWSGPTWIVANWFLFESFETSGLEEEAKRLYKSVRDLIEKSGFREYSIQSPEKVMVQKILPGRVWL